MACLQRLCPKDGSLSSIRSFQETGGRPQRTFKFRFDSHSLQSIVIDMSRSRISCLVLLAITVAMVATGAEAARRVALVIGNSNYINTARLTNPANDSADIAAELRSLGFEVIYGADATKASMDQSIEQFARLSKDAEAALFFYAGHGMQFEGRNYIMPVDAQLEDEVSLRYQMIAIDDVRAAIERASGVKILILDACRNNPLAERLIRSISVGSRDVAAVRGFTRPEQMRGMVVAYATQANDTAQDGGGRNSPFTTALLDELKVPGLEIGVLFRRVASKVYTATKGRQVPELSISLLSDYALNTSETDQTAWARVRASTNVADVRSFVERFPTSFYAPDARLRLKLLEHAGPDVAALMAPTSSLEEPTSLGPITGLRNEPAGAAELPSKAAASMPSEEGSAKVRAEPAVAIPTTVTVPGRDGTGAQHLASLETSNLAAAGAGNGLIAGILARGIKVELQRLGCYQGALDEIWDSTATKKGLATLARYASLSVPAGPTAAYLEALRARPDRICPLVCSPLETEQGGHCVRRSCGPGEILDMAGDCTAHTVRNRSLPQQPKHRLAVVHAPAPSRPPRREAAPVIASASASHRVSEPEPRHATGHGKCFSFNGRSFCE
ncbi:caspase domain-containing protein [Methylobacterium sp. J-067]|uniref:caspase family protein n=1 Tax=Methylobacterium sp. J-067 TaxID=2836648 RepID=UPI001FB8B9A4|nr:caspase domain-containing protein [Methylobacterium sp. J-067]MCJ2025147.1 caspase domain-containing protein [Methylobacterium sp. J-067]